VGSENADFDLGIKYQTIDAGLLYRISPTHRIGLMVKNIIDIHESSNSPDNIPENSTFSLPLYTTLGYSIHYRGVLLSFDNELIYGHYGGTQSKKATFWFVRAGAEKKFNKWLTLRCGLTIPLLAKTDTLGNIRNDLPWPKMGGAVGAGLKYERFTFDFSVYGDPAKSYVNQSIRIKTVFSLTIDI